MNEVMSKLKNELQEKRKNIMVDSKSFIEKCNNTEENILKYSKLIDEQAKILQEQLLSVLNALKTVINYKSAHDLHKAKNLGDVMAFIKLDFDELQLKTVKMKHIPDEIK
ncbi:MAG: hypothetical protein MHPSP_002047, partial [Paramarteilia canceri]